MTLLTLLILALTPVAKSVYETDVTGKVNFVGTIAVTIPGPRTPPQQMPNWPKSMGTHPNYKPTGAVLADLNQDGDLEVIAGSTDNLLYAWDYQGNAMPGFPVTLPAPIQAKTAVGDLDNNGDLEVVVAARNGYVYVYNHDGSPFPGWPQNGNGVIGFVSPSLFDLDRNGDLEIIMPQMQSGQPGHVYVWHHNGQVHAGWPKDTDYLAVATASVSDIDNDGVFEICVAAYRSIYVWDQNGNTEPGWPRLNVASGSSYAQPVMADLDGDGDIEILFAYYLSAQDYVGIYHHNGTDFTNWPQTFPGPQHYTTPVTGDIDRDLDLEVFGGGHVFGGPNLLARHHTGAELPGWPVCNMLECSPAICDVDNDGYREVVVADNVSPGSLHAFNYDASNAPDWPVTTSAAALVNSVSVGDVDLDGDMEVALVLMDGSVNLWTIDSMPYRGYLTDWGTFYHDQWNTGWFHPKPPVTLTGARFPGYVRLGWRRNTEPDIAGYNVYRSLTGGGPFTRISRRVVPDTTYHDSTAAPGTNYYYCVTAQIKACHESRLSNEAAVVGIAENTAHGRNSLRLFPNPFSRSLHLSSAGPNRLQARIYDVSGQLVGQLSGGSMLQWRPLPHVPDGIYFVELSTDGQSIRHKVVKSSRH